MEKQAVQDWLDRYVEAWKTYDAGRIGELFTEEATYRYHPYDSGDDIVRGREAIVRAWLEPDGSASSRDEPGTYDARYEAWAVDGDRAVAVGWSRYWTDASQAQERALYHNIFLLEFDAEGRCAEFTEYFVEAPGRS